MKPTTRCSFAVLLLLLPWPAGAAASPQEPSRPAARSAAVSPAEPPATAEAVRAWYGRYRRGAAPVKRALGVLIAARGEHRPDRWRRRVAAACSDLGEALAELARDSERTGVLPVPDRAADFHLRRGLGALSEAAAHCGRGRYEAMELALGRAGRSLRQAAFVLARYGVEP